MPNGHHVTHIISANSAHVALIFQRQQPKIVLFSVFIQEGHVLPVQKNVLFRLFPFSFSFDAYIPGVNPVL